MKHLWKHPLIRRRAPTIRKRRETAQIFERYKNALFHTARRMTASDSDAEDAVMMAMERVCRHMERIRTLSEPEVQAYLYKTVRSCAIDLWRSKKRQEDVLLLYTAEIPEEAWQDMDAAEDFGETERYVEKLPEKYRTVITLFYRDGYTMREMAEMLHIAESTVGTRLSRTREMLRKMITEGEIPCEKP